MGFIIYHNIRMEYDKFADWLARRPPAFFVSTFGKASREENTTLQHMLRERGVRFQDTLPASLARGSVAFVAADDEVKHVDFMTEAWVDDPLKVVHGASSRVRATNRSSSSAAAPWSIESSATRTPCSSVEEPPPA